MKRININYIKYSELYESIDLIKCREFHIKKGQKFIKKNFNKIFEILNFYEYFFITDSIFLLLGSYISKQCGITLVFYRIYLNNQQQNTIFETSSNIEIFYPASLNVMNKFKSISYISNDLINFKLHPSLISFHMNSLKKKKSN